MRRLVRNPTIQHVITDLYTKYDFSSLHSCREIFDGKVLRNYGRTDGRKDDNARQRIHIKHQISFSSKDKSKNIKVSSAAFLFGALRVNEKIDKLKEYVFRERIKDHTVLLFCCRHFCNNAYNVTSVILKCEL